MSGCKVGKDFKAFRRTTPSSVRQEGLDRWSELGLLGFFIEKLKGILPSYYPIILSSLLPHAGSLLLPFPLSTLPFFLLLSPFQFNPIFFSSGLSIDISLSWYSSCFTPGLPSAPLCRLKLNEETLSPELPSTGTPKVDVCIALSSATSQCSDRRSNWQNWV